MLSITGRRSIGICQSNDYLISSGHLQQVLLSFLQVEVLLLAAFCSGKEYSWMNLIFTLKSHMFFKFFLHTFLEIFQVWKRFEKFSKLFFEKYCSIHAKHFQIRYFHGSENFVLKKGFKAVFGERELRIICFNMEIRLIWGYNSIVVATL